MYLTKKRNESSNNIAWHEIINQVLNRRYCQVSLDNYSTDDSSNSIDIYDINREFNWTILWMLAYPSVHRLVTLIAQLRLDEWKPSLSMKVWSTYSERSHGYNYQDEKFSSRSWWDQFISGRCVPRLTSHRQITQWKINLLNKFHAAALNINEYVLGKTLDLTKAFNTVRVIMIFSGVSYQATAFMD